MSWLGAGESAAGWTVGCYKTFGWLTTGLMVGSGVAGAAPCAMASPPIGYSGGDDDAMSHDAGMIAP